MTRVKPRRHEQRPTVVRLEPLAALVVVVATAAGCASSSGADTLGAPTETPSTVSAVAGTATASPGRVVTASAVPASSPTPRPTRTGPVTLTDSDSGDTVSVRVGDQISVVLGANGQQWDQPTAQGDAVRRTSASGGYPTTQPARATFIAVAVGGARLEATSDAACLHSEPPCMMAQRAWSVDVVVHR